MEEIRKYGLKDKVNCKAKTLKWKLRSASQKTVDTVGRWCSENPEAVTTIVVGSALGLVKIGKSMAKKQAVKQEQHWKDTHIYDHSTGKYVELRRKLKGSEYAAVLDRKETSGKSISSVLNEMGYLK